MVGKKCKSQSSIAPKCLEDWDSQNIKISKDVGSIKEVTGGGVTSLKWVKFVLKLIGFGLLIRVNNSSKGWAPQLMLYFCVYDED